MMVGYARVSTDLQTTDGQIDALHAAGCERVFEESMSGTRADRPQLAAALEFAREGDVLVVARLDRLARSMRQLLNSRWSFCVKELELPYRLVVRVVALAAVRRH